MAVQTGPATVRVVLPYPLYTLAQCAAELTLHVPRPEIGRAHV